MVYFFQSILHQCQHIDTRLNEHIPKNMSPTIVKVNVCFCIAQYIDSGAAKVALSPNRSVFEEGIKLSTSVLWYNIIKIDPQNPQPLVAAILISNMVQT